MSNAVDKSRLIEEIMRYTSTLRVWFRKVFLQCLRARTIVQNVVEDGVRRPGVAQLNGCTQQIGAFIVVVLEDKRGGIVLSKTEQVLEGLVLSILNRHHQY